MISILIPTYNRDEFLLKNIEELTKTINKNNLNNEVEIIISNNCSTDKTFNLLENLKDKTAIDIKIFHQSKNIGLRDNALFVLSKSLKPYVMYLGDDDYLENEYLIECFNILKSNVSISTIIPNFVPINENKQIVGSPRDLENEIRRFKKGFISTLKNSWRGHQMSGLIFKREGLLENYYKYKVSNIYLFIYFTGISCMSGDTYHVSKYPIKVTQPTKKKDWGYGNDGLINEIFQNYKKMPVNYFERFLLEIYFVHKQTWRLYMYKKNGLWELLNSYKNICIPSNGTLLYKVISWPFLFVKIVNHSIKS